MDERHVLAVSLGRNALPYDHFEPSRAATGMHISSIQPERQRRFWRRNGLTGFRRAGIEKTRSFLSQFRFQPFGYFMQVASQAHGIDFLPQWQYFLEQFRADPEGQQGTPLGFQIQQFGCGPLRQQFRQWTEGLFGHRFAAAAMQP